MDDRITTLTMSEAPTTIKAARERAGLSQREVARRLGFDETSYGKIERGDRVLDVVEFVALAGALGTDPLTLFADYLLALQRLRVFAIAKIL